MVKGLDIFRDRFSAFEGSFILIGGAACDLWFDQLSQPFRATQDLDLVLLVEVIDASFVKAMRDFITEGGYQSRQRTNGSPELYRFANPTQPSFPAEIELFSRNPTGFELSPGEVIPVAIEADHHSLSAILLNEDYYSLIRSHHDNRGGLNVANAISLIPLKAFAWLDLTRRKAEGEPIDSKKIKKHRNDVCLLAATLPGEPGPALPPSILADLSGFLDALPPESPEWQAILESLKMNPASRGIPAATLCRTILTYFNITQE
ncbi:MAG: hypothetical protein RLZZ245_3174 [Verrucomicrobiota bacterium]